MDVRNKNKMIDHSIKNLQTDKIRFEYKINVHLGNKSALFAYVKQSFI